MLSITDILHEKLTKKNIGRQFVGLLCINVVQNFCGDPSIEGYVRFDKVFIKVTDHAKKIVVFQHKKEILTNINEKLANLGQTKKMSDIVFVR